MGGAVSGFLGRCSAGAGWQELRGVPFRDDSFDEKDWLYHMTWKRYVPEPAVISIVVISLAPIWMWSVAVSAALGLYATYAEPAGAPNVSQHPSLVVPFQLTSFALSLLMLFKTTSSYSRWWEARVLWGNGYIAVRSTLRLAISFVGRDHPELLPAMYRWTAAILPALAAYLRQRGHYFDDHLGGLLLPAELDWLRQRGIPPVAALQVLSALLDRAQLSDIQRQQLEAQLSHFDTIIGGCERILRQAIPRAWNRHTHRFILVYITFLPFAFWSLFGWFTLPIMAVFTFLLCGVENVGIQIEEPHRALPLNQICASGLRALRFMMADHLGAGGATSVQAMAHLSAAFGGLQAAEAPVELGRPSGSSSAKQHPPAGVGAARSSSQAHGRANGSGAATGTGAGVELWKSITVPI